MPTTDIPTTSVAADITLPTGRIHGRRDGNVLVYNGIPYALPPVGPLRFAAPHPLPHGTRILNDTAAEPVAPPQLPSPFARFLGDPQNAMGEDCLHLNIWAPVSVADGPLPVLVLLHGGSYMIGDAQLPRYSGAEFAVEQNLIVVTVNYRVGILGFVPHPAAIEATITSTHDGAIDFGTGDAPVLNAGWLDMVASLAWIRRNIAEFGGDPAKVTVAGQSAGGHALTALLGHSQVRRLFSRAVFHSAPFGLPSMSREQAGKLTNSVTAAIGDNWHDASVSSLLAAQRDTATAPRTFADVAPPIRLVESTSTPVNICDAITESDDLSGMHIQLGWNHDEALFWFAFDPQAKSAGTPIIQSLLNDWSDRPADATLDTYRSRYSTAAHHLVAGIQTERFFVQPLINFEKKLHAQGASTRRYELTWGPRGDYRFLGACHTLDLAFLFGTEVSRSAPWLIGEDPAELTELRTLMRTAWAHLAAERNDTAPMGDPARGFTLTLN